MFSNVEPDPPELLVDAPDCARRSSFPPLDCSLRLAELEDGASPQSRAELLSQSLLAWAAAPMAQSAAAAIIKRPRVIASSLIRPVGLMAEAARLLRRD